MFYTGDPELKALEQRNLQYRAQAFGVLARAARNGLAALAGRLRGRRGRIDRGAGPCTC